jgi:hypothetical protein
MLTRLLALRIPSRARLIPSLSAQILLHFNPRVERGGCLVVNDKMGGDWGRGQRIPATECPPMFPLTRAQLAFHFKPDHIDVSLNSHTFLRYFYRTSMPRDGDNLFLHVRAPSLGSVRWKGPALTMIPRRSQSVTTTACPKLGSSIRVSSPTPSRSAPAARVTSRVLPAASLVGLCVHAGRFRGPLALGWLDNNDWESVHTRHHVHRDVTESRGGSHACAAEDSLFPLVGSCTEFQLQLAQMIRRPCKMSFAPISGPNR